MSGEEASGGPLPPATEGEEPAGPAPSGEAAGEAANGGPPVADAAAAAAADDGGFRHRHPDALKLDLAIGGGFLGCATLAVFAATTLLVLAGLSPWLLAAAVLVPAILAVPLLAVPRWRHRRYLYRVDERGLELRQGVWWRSHRFIAHTRVQHTDVAQGPLQRQLGLANLVVHTAGTHAARTTVSGLALAGARELRDRLTAEIVAGDDGV